MATISLRRGFSVNVFLPSGDPDGLKVVEKSNWTGRGLVIPRPMFAEARGRTELDRTGVYLLVGPGELSSEINAQGFHGALVQTTSAQLHPGKLGVGLGEAAVRAGARIWENAPVEGMERAGFRVIHTYGLTETYGPAVFTC